MNQVSYRQTAQLFQLLSHPVRLQILDELRRGAACVCHLQALLGRPQAYVSQQLRVLREAGAIDCYKDGLFVYYQLADPLVERLLEEMLGPAAEAEPLPRCTCPFCRGEC